MPIDDNSPLPAKVGRYHVLRLLGAGGMGAVYEAYDAELSRKVAIKVLHPSTSSEADSARIGYLRARLLREAKILARVGHPNIVQIFDVGVFADDAVFLAMEFVAGETLRAHIESKKLFWRQGLAYVLQAADGLACAHEAGLLHRDFKPDNILVGSDKIVRVLDFGLAKEANAVENERAADSCAPVGEGERGHQGDSDGLTGFGSVLGTLGYMAPEQFAGDPTDQASDLFALCCVLFEVLTGARPFRSTSHESLASAVIEAKLPWPAQIPIWLRRVVARGLAFESDRRGPGVGMLAAEIRHHLLRESRRKKTVRVLLAAVVPACIGVAWWLRPEPPQDPDCRDPSHLIAELWNDTARLRGSASFVNTGSSLAAELWQRSASALDAWQKGWTQAAAQLCPATREASAMPIFDSTLREQSRACLSESRAEVATLLQIWQRPTLRHVMQSSGAIASLSRPADCMDPEHLRSRMPLPADPARRSWVLAQADAIQGARIRIGQADYAGAREALEAVRLHLSEAFDIGVQAQWTAVVGQLAYVDSGKDLESSGALQAATLWAIAANRPELDSRSRANLWFSRVYSANLQDEAEDLLRSHRAAIERAGRPPRLLAEYERYLGIWASMHGDFVAALPHFQDALAHTQEAFGKSSSPLAAALGDLGYTALLMGDSPVAESYFRKSQQMQAELLPMGHPARSLATEVLAESLSAAGRPMQALAETLLAWPQCFSEKIETIACAQLFTSAVAHLTTLGDLSTAQNLATPLLELETHFGRRFWATSAWTQQSLSSILADRGELSTALALSKQGVIKLLAEGEVHPAALAQTLSQAADISIRAGEFSDAQSYLLQMSSVLDIPSGEAADYRTTLGHLKARLELATHRPTTAILGFEEALRDQLERGRPSYDLAWVYLDCAKGLLALNQRGLAADYARRGLALQQAIEGISPALALTFHETLAEIALAEGHFDDALHQLELAKLAFDPVQVLGNRRAPLCFLEAKLRWEVDPSQTGHASARALANQALQYYRDWDAGAQSQMAVVVHWLQSH